MLAVIYINQYINQKVEAKIKKYLNKKLLNFENKMKKNILYGFLTASLVLAAIVAAIPSVNAAEVEKQQCGTGGSSCGMSYSYDQHYRCGCYPVRTIPNQTCPTGQCTQPYSYNLVYQCGCYPISDGATGHYDSSTGNYNMMPGGAMMPNMPNENMSNFPGGGAFGSRNDNFSGFNDIRDRFNRKYYGNQNNNSNGDSDNDNEDNGANNNDNED